tara:strand:+ start:238 stop:465 length:228 start_codon:yes stop_codon:yes gene_type:complete
MKITHHQLRRIIHEALINESKPLAISGGPGKRIPGYHFDRVHQVHVRDDYNPRTDYGDELDKAIQKLHDEELRKM